MCFGVGEAALIAGTTAAATQLTAPAVLTPAITAAVTGTATLAPALPALPALGSSLVAGATVVPTATTVGATTTAGAILGNVTLGGTILGGAGSIASVVAQAQAAKEAADYNEAASKVAADQERQAAAQRAGVAIRQAGLAASAQRAAFGGSGFDATVGDPLVIIKSTLEEGARDAAAEFTAGQRRASAREVEAENARISGRSARNQAIGSSFGTVLGTSGQVADVWYRFRG